MHTDQTVYVWTFLNIEVSWLFT